MSIKKIEHSPKGDEAGTQPSASDADDPTRCDQILSALNVQRLSHSGMLQPARTLVFDRVVDQARRIFGCHASMLTILDEENDRQFFKAESGLLSNPNAARETSLSHSICQIVIRDSGPVVIVDTKTDPRVAGNEAIALHNIGAYLGVPVKDETGQAIAALCLVEQGPREWTSANIEVLQAFAEGVSTQIRSMFQPEKVRANGRSPISNVPFRIGKVAGASMTYVHGPDGAEGIEAASPETQEIWGITGADYIARYADVFGMCLIEDYPLARASFGNSAGGMIPWHHRWRIRLSQGEVRWLEGHGLPRSAPDGTIKWTCIIGDVTPMSQ